MYQRRAVWHGIVCPAEIGARNQAPTARNHEEGDDDEEEDDVDDEDDDDMMMRGRRRRRTFMRREVLGYWTQESGTNCSQS